MDEHTLMMITLLFLDARMAAADVRALDNARFEEVLTLLSPCTDRAGGWLRYCCQTLRDLMAAKAPSVYDFADTVHNTARLYGLANGRLLIPRGYWDSEMQRFRERYGELYFADFTSDIVADQLVERMRTEEAHRFTPPSQRLH